MNKQVKIELDGDTGEIAEVFTELGKTGVNIESLFSKRTGSKQIIHFITNDPKTAREVLEKKGIEPEVTDILILKLQDRPGELGKVTRKLAHEEIEMNSLYILGREEERTRIAVEASEKEKAKQVLSKYYEDPS